YRACLAIRPLWLSQDRRAPAPGGLDNQRQAGRAYLATRGAHRIWSLHRLLACALEEDRGWPAAGGGWVGNSQFIARNSVAERLRGSRPIRERRPLDLHRE